MYCRKCGAKIPDGATFCSKCGAPISEDVSNPHVESQNNSVGKWFVIFAILVVLCGASAYFVFSNGSTKSTESVLESAEDSSYVSPEEQQEELDNKIREQLFEEANKENPGVLQGPQDFRDLTKTSDGTYEATFSYHDGYDNFTYKITGIEVDNTGKVTSFGTAELTNIRGDADKPMPSINAEKQYEYYQQKVQEGNRYGGW